MYIEGYSLHLPYSWVFCSVFLRGPLYIEIIKDNTDNAVRKWSEIMLVRYAIYMFLDTIY